MVNLGCVDLNPHPVRAEDLDHPDELRVDLDPMPGVEWGQIVDVALVAREVLEEHGLTAWPKTSGSRGFHIYARIDPQWSYRDVRLAAETVAREVEIRVPDLATARWWKEEREGVFVDFNQNAKDRTVASAYSVRPLPDARVSTPLAWDEVPDCRPADFTLPTVLDRWAERGDPWAGIESAPRVAGAAARPGPPARPGGEAAEGRGAPAADPAADRDRPLEDQGRVTGRPRYLEGPARRRSSAIWSRPTCWSTACAGEARSGTASASTSNTSPSRSAPNRSRWKSTTTLGRQEPVHKDRWANAPDRR